MSTQWIPNYIKRSMEYSPKDVLTAQEFNAILNLLITQGDYNSSWLEYLQNEGIPEAIADLSATAIASAISAAVTQEIAALTASVINKTSAQLNAPMLTILNTGFGITGINDLKLLMDSKSLKFTNAVKTNLIDQNSAYPTKTQLLNLQTAGESIIAYSTDGATITPSTVDTVTAAAYQYMNFNGFNKKVFVYPDGNSNDVVRDTVHATFPYAVNIINSGTIIPDGILEDSPASVLGNIAVVHYDNTVTVASIKAIIDDAVQHNKYVILQIDTDSAAYNATGFEEILDYALTQTGIVYPESIDTAMGMIHNTIGNEIIKLQRINVTIVDGEKYLNW